MACSVAGWAWVLDDELTTPVAWRVAWALIGLPNPLPEPEWRHLFQAVEVAYGVTELLRGLRLAADQPPLSGGWTPERRAGVCALLDAYERLAKGIAA